MNLINNQNDNIKEMMKVVKNASAIEVLEAYFNQHEPINKLFIYILEELSKEQNKNETRR